MPDRQRRVPWWVKIAVLFHAFMILSWSIPPPARAIVQGVTEPRGEEYLLVANQKFKLSPFANYMTVTGFWQSWDMFAPNPASVDIWCHADIEYADGTEVRYNYPRMKDLPIPKKYVKERYRKFYERVNQDDNAYIWPYFAQRIAMINTYDPKNLPVKVRLTRHWMTIPPPDKPLPTEYSTYTFYEYLVDIGKLKHDLRLN
jgi:hypothetical protein